MTKPYHAFVWLMAAASMAGIGVDISCGATTKSAVGTVVNTVVTSVRDCVKDQIAKEVPGVLRRVRAILASALESDWVGALADVASFIPDGAAVVTCAVLEIRDASLKEIQANRVDGKMSLADVTHRVLLVRSGAYLAQVGVTKPASAQ